MNRLPLFLIFFASCLLPIGCGVGEGTGSTPPWRQTETPVAPAATEDIELEERTVEVIEPYRVKMETTKGAVVIQVNPEWAPHGAIRFRKLVEAGFYDDNRIFRVVPEFVVQFGMNGDPAVHAEWTSQPIPDDPVKESNRRGYVTFATSGPDSRTTQIFINLSDNTRLDSMSFAPFGEVVEGMDVVDQFNSQYGESITQRQGEIAAEGNAFLDREFPGLDTIVKATVIEAGQQQAPATSGEENPAGSAEQPPVAPETTPEQTPQDQPSSDDSFQEAAQEAPSGEASGPQ
jgi:peptidyl-prolyl cis-trans isomerase A (cyclophilin A)